MWDSIIFTFRNGQLRIVFIQLKRYGLIYKNVCRYVDEWTPTLGEFNKGIYFHKSSETFNRAAVYHFNYCLNHSTINRYDQLEKKITHAPKHV